MPLRRRHSALGGRGAAVAALRLAACLCACGAGVAAAQPDKSGVSPKAVSLPAGAGTARGLEGYDADLSSGTATYAIALEVPAQATGTTPILELGYESGGGNGILGFGWGLSYGWAVDVGGVLQRRTSKALPRYVDGANGLDDDGDGAIDEADEPDQFTAEGGKILVPLEDGYCFGIQEDTFYRYARHCNAPPECEEKKRDAMRTSRKRFGGPGPDEVDPGELACVDAPTLEDGSPCPDGWDVEYPNGYGGVLGQQASSRISNPETGEVFAWLLDEEYDTTGNRNLYKYAAFDGERNLNQKYLQEIEIVDFTNWSTDLCAGTYPWTSYRFVYFAYEDRSDMFESCESGFPVRTGKRLKEIYVGVQGVPAQEGHVEGDFNQDGVADWLARRYVLEYAPGHWSRLVRMTQYGSDNASTLPGPAFTYNACEYPDALDASGSIIGVENAPPVLWDSGSADLTEIDGDGLADLLKTEPAGGLHTAYLNRGEKTLPGGGRVVVWSDAIGVPGDARTYNINLLEDSGYSAWLNDMDADGIADLVYDADETYWFPAQVTASGLEWGERTRMNLAPDTTYPPSPFSTDATTYEDLDGNERADIMQSVQVGGQSYYRIWYNLGGETYSEGITATPINGLTLSDEGAGLEDFNGDGLPDIVRVLPSGIEVAAGLGYGDFAPRRLVPLPDFTIGIIHAQEAGLEDVNADGLPDLVIERAAPGELWYWINRGDYSLDGRRIVTGLPASWANTPATRWTDINGNGTTDLVYADRWSDPPMRAVDLGELIGCVPAPNLLTRVDNGIGGAIVFEYATSLPYQQADEAAGDAWPDPNPELAVVIAKKTELDGYGSEYATRYVYHDGYYKYHPDFDLFAGFGRVEEIVEGGPGAPTSVHTMEFDVGRDNVYFRGNMVFEAYTDEAGAAFWEERTEYGLTQLYTGIDGKPVQLVRPSRIVRDLLEQGRGTPRRTETTLEYDEWGNTAVESIYGIVEGDDRTAFNDETINDKIYTFNCRDWLVNYVARAEVFDYAGNRVRRDEIFYDNETYIDDVFRFTLFGGNTQGRSYADPDNLDAFVQTIRIKYDQSGNTGFWIDGLGATDDEGTPDDEVGHYRVDDYEDFFQNFLVQETHHVGGGKPDLIAAYDYDYGHGKLTASRDFGGNETRYKYDVFGRVVALIRPGDSDDFPTEEYAYAEAIPFGGGLINYVELRKLDREPGTPGLSKRDHYAISRQYTDGLGRELLTKTEAEPDPATGRPRVIVTGAGNFSVRGNVSEDFNAYFSTQPGDTLDALLEYEDIAADGWTGAFAEDGGFVPYGYDDAPRVIHDFDALLREVKTTNQDGSFSSTVFEPLREVVSDENDNDPASPSFGTPTVYTYDGQERLVQVDELVRIGDDGGPSGDLQTWSTRYEFRADGLIARIIDAQNNMRTYTYDGLGRLIAADDPDTGVSVYAYDDASNEIGVEDGKGAATVYTFDGVNRLLTVDLKDEDEEFSFGYRYDPSLPIDDTNRPDVAYYYDDVFDAPDGSGATFPTINAAGKPAKVLDQYGTFYYAYDARGQQTLEGSVLNHPRTGAEVAYLARFAYDRQGRLASIVYPDRDRAAYAYNERGLLRAVAGGGALHADGGNFMLKDLAYNPDGTRSAATYGDGTRLERRYDLRSRLTGLELARLSDPDNPLLDYAYGFDAASNIVRIDDLRPETVHPAGDPLRNTQIVAYDDAYRMTRMQYSFAAPGQPDADDGTIEFRYDRLGNLIFQSSTAADLPGATPSNLGTLSYGGDLGSSNRAGSAEGQPGPHLLTRIEGPGGIETFGYDDGGALTQKDDIALQYDYESRIVQADGPDFRARYTYDIDGLRLLRRVWRKQADGTIEDRPYVFAQYLGNYYDLREGEDPMKYVYDPDATLALVRGSMDADAPRSQRFLASAGWNLFAMAVSAPDAVAQLGLGDGTVEAIYTVDPASNLPLPATESSALPAGTAFWLYAGAAVSLTVTGDYDDNAAAVGIENGYVALSRIGATQLEGVAPETFRSVWAFDSAAQTWRALFGGDIAFLSDLGEVVEASNAFYVQLDGPGSVTPPPASWGIEYYHGDHLTSSNLITDAAGNVLEESVFHPYGEFRHRERAANFRGNPYQYINRERDDETGFSDFEARYLVMGLARFVSADPLLEELPDEYLENPQLLNPYAYSGNNPITFFDPTGLNRERANQVINKLNPFGGKSALEIGQVKRGIYFTLQVNKGGALPNFNTTDNLFKRKAVQQKVTDIKTQYGAFDLNKFLPINRKLNQLGAKTLKIQQKDGTLADTAIDVKPLQQFLFGKPTGTGPQGKPTSLAPEAAKQINALKDRLDKLDLDKEFGRLKGIAGEALKRQEFKFDNEQADRLSDLLPDGSKQFGL